MGKNRIEMKKIKYEKEKIKVYQTIKKYVLVN